MPMKRRLPESKAKPIRENFAKVLLESKLYLVCYLCGDPTCEYTHFEACMGAQGVAAFARHLNDEHGIPEVVVASIDGLTVLTPEQGDELKAQAKALDSGMAGHA